MADEDEIDVLGDFDLDNLLSKSNSGIYDSPQLVSQNTELLNCDYTIHPQWLLDRPSADPENWYDRGVASGIQENTADENTVGRLGMEDSITDESGWTENEKNLLEQGIEIFGRSNARLSQFIGSKTTSEVKYYLKNFYAENHSCISLNILEDGVGTDLVADVLHDSQIPASIEEVIAAVSTAKPTVPTNTPKPRKKIPPSCSNSEIFKSQASSSKFSLLKSTSPKKLPADPVGVRHKIHSMLSKTGNLKKGAAKFKVNARLKGPVRDLKRQRIINTKVVNISRKQSTHNDNGGRNVPVLISEGEEVVKLSRDENESDDDIDIDVEVSDEENLSNTKAQTQSHHDQATSLLEKIDTSRNETNISKIQECSLSSESLIVPNDVIDLSKLDEVTVNLLTTLDEPSVEYHLNENALSDVEKVINSEYFTGKPSKTPARYLMIRNHILKGWMTQRPNYLRKTQSRKGLKNCGDVNSFGRIHNFLEQIGAINFGCGQVSYLRPLSNFIQDQPVERDKPVKEVKSVLRFPGELGSRSRNKMKKFNNDGDGGCTLAHDEEGHVIKTTVINEEPIVKRTYMKKPSIRLLYCRPFTEETPQPYRITISLSTLLILDFHAHTSLTEIMGLVAGYWIPDAKTLEITHYEPCLNIASSSTHCDMCPISQAKAADTIHEQGLDILGWFHSHPTFAPEPSQQDLDTQQMVQQWIGSSNPCIGIILSPFSLNGALIASPYRCMIVNKKNNFEDQFVPFKFHVEVISENFVVLDFLREIRRILKCSIAGNKKNRVDFLKPYLQDNNISFMEKYITSVRMHLARCGTLNEMTCDSIINGITYICSAKSKS